MLQRSLTPIVALAAASLLGACDSSRPTATPGCVGPDCVTPGSGGGVGTGGGDGSGGGVVATGGGAAVVPEGLEGLRAFSCTHGLAASLVTEDRIFNHYLFWKERYVASCPDGSLRVIDTQQNDRTVSEGIGYGMLLASAVGDRPLFDGLWAFYQSHRNSQGLMDWEWLDCTRPGDDTPASDADLDTALALIVGEHRWGGYRSYAQTLINAIWQYETADCSGTRALLASPQHGCSNLNPSYFSPGYYRVFAQFYPGATGDWNRLTSDTYTLLARLQGQNNGLVPDWVAATGGTGTYGYEACRTPWRIATDYAWSSAAEARTFLMNVSAYVDSQGGIANVPLDRNSCFLGGLALSGAAVSQEVLDAYVNDWLSYASDSYYYQNTLKGLLLLAAGCRFLPT
jgi:endo-1,4-beta-D-glucanase Y